MRVHRLKDTEESQTVDANVLLVTIVILKIIIETNNILLTFSMCFHLTLFLAYHNLIIYI